MRGTLPHTNLERFRRYLKDYGPPNPKDREAAFERFHNSSDSSSLLGRFVSLVFG